MRLSAPKKIVFWISVILVVLALVAYFVTSLGFQSYAIWLALVGYLLLAAGNVLKGF